MSQSLGGSIVVGGTGRASSTPGGERQRAQRRDGDAADITITSPTADPTTTAVSTFITLAGTAVGRHRRRVGRVGQRPRRQRRGHRHDELDGAEHPARRRGQRHHRDRDRRQRQRDDRHAHRHGDAVCPTSSPKARPARSSTSTSSSPTRPRTPAPIVVTFLRENGTTVVQNLTVNRDVARDDSRRRHRRGSKAPSPSTVITSTNGLPLIVERTMFWDAQHYGVARRHGRRRAAHALAVCRGVAGLLQHLRPAGQRGRHVGDGDDDVPDGDGRTGGAHLHGRADVAADGLGRRDPGARQPLVLDRRRLLRCRSSPSGRCTSARPASGTAATSRPGVPDAARTWFLAEGRDRPVLRDLHPGRQPEPEPGERHVHVPDRARARP